MDFDKLIDKFQEGWSLEAYIRASPETKDKNQRIIDDFAKEGQKGIDYLCKELNSDDLLIREQAAHIIGEIKKESQDQRLLHILAKRKEVEPETGVVWRIIYAQEMINGYSPEDVLELYKNPPRPELGSYSLWSH